MPIELGVDSLTFTVEIDRGEMTSSDVVDAARELDLRWVQFNSFQYSGPGQAKAAGEAAARGGLSVIWSGDDVGAAGTSLEDAEGRLERWLDQAEAAGAKILRAYNGWYRFEALAASNLPDQIRFLERFLPRAGDACARRGITLALENHSNFMARELAGVLSRVNHPNVRVHLDAVNAVSIPEDPLAVVETLAPLSVSGHIKDYAMASAQAAKHRRYRAGFDLRFRYPGQGQAPLADILSATNAALGARSIPLCVEGLDDSVPDARRALAGSIAHLRSLLAR